jgi:hypothetical protein
MKSVSKIVINGLIMSDSLLHFLALSGNDGYAVEPSGVYPRARPEQSMCSLVSGTQQNYEDFCTEVANYQRANTREFAHGVSAREGRACKREYKAIARRQPAIERWRNRSGLLELYKRRRNAVRTRATDDFKDGPLPGTRVPVGQEALVSYVEGGSGVPVGGAGYRKGNRTVYTCAAEYEELWR